MASKTDKIIRIAEDTRQRIQSGERPEFSPKYKVNVISYSWDHHKKISKIKDINEVGKLYDLLISERIGIEQTPRTINVKGRTLPNRARPPFMFLNLSRFSEFLDGVGTEGSKEISKVFRMTEVKNPTVDGKIQKVMDCARDLVEMYFKHDEIFTEMDTVDLENFRENMSMMVNMADGILKGRVDPEPEKTGAQNVPIEPFNGSDSSKGYVDTSEEIRQDVDREMERITRVSVPVPEPMFKEMPRISFKRGRRPEPYDGRFILFGVLNGETVQAVFGSNDLDNLIEVYGKSNGSYSKLIWSRS